MKSYKCSKTEERWVLAKVLVKCLCLFVRKGQNVRQ